MNEKHTEYIKGEKSFKIGKKYYHKHRGSCIFSMACYILESRNPEPSSIYMDFEQPIDDILEVSIQLVSDYKE